ncbi:hypothetical protein GCM10023107_41870 [Actinoplanes octamycinicus]|uniref:hypothetical protein n=1 Tax=Actinoplanes octamycinicus TaxID=135948 RepID=UPI0031E568DD
MLGSAAVFVIGTVMFSVSMLRARVFPWLPAAGYGVMFTLLALLAPLPDTPWTSVVHVLAGGCLIWLCASVWSSEQAATRPSGAMTATAGTRLAGRA